MTGPAANAHLRAEVEKLLPTLVGDVAPDVLLRWVPDSCTSSAGVTRGGQCVVRLGESLLLDRAQAMFFAAHEAGHVALGHTRRRRHVITVVWFIGPVLCLVVGAVGLICAGLMPLPLAGLLPLASLIVLHGVLRLRSRPLEYAADHYAADRGYPIARVAEPATGWHWTHEILPTHPSWTRRQRRCLRTLDRSCG